MESRPKKRTAAPKPQRKKAAEKPNRRAAKSAAKAAAPAPKAARIPVPKPPKPRTDSAGKARKATLLGLEEALGQRIVGKGDAIATIARVIRVRMTQLDFRPERPNGSFLLIGPPGVGKNEIAYTLAEVLYGSEDHVVSIDLGEIADEEDLAKLGASPIPGIEGHFLEGMLTSPVRENPEAVLLLRGLEQAHVAFQRVLLQILERGALTDMVGTVDFSKTIIFTTVHLSREELAPGEIGFGRPSKTAEEQLREHLQRHVLADLLDAFNEVIELPPLTPPEVRQIARYKVGQILQRMQKRHKRIRVAEAVYQELIPETLCRTGSAKFLNRTLEERLFNPLARYLLTHERQRAIDVGVQRGEIVIRSQGE